MDEEILDISTDIIPKSKTIPSVCKICGAPALYKYFGIISCHACKIFFKRNAQIGLKILKCYRNEICEINIHNRHVCALCRLKKCFNNGMKIELIRSSRKRKKNEINEPYQSQMGTKVIINKIQLKFNTNQWNLLFYLIHSYEEYNILLHIQQFIQEQKSLPIKLRFKVTSFNVLFGSILSGIERFFKMNNDFVSLCCHDRSILLRCAMENAGCFGSILVLHANYPDIRESIGNNFQRILINLRKYSHHQIDRDVTFIKLGIAMFAFSTTNCSSYTNIGLNYFKNIKDILRIQDIYAEITWKYLLYKSDHRQTVKWFIDFIQCLLIINTTIVETHQSQYDKRIIENLIEMINRQIPIRK